jgi:hypothetical protein
MLSHDARIDFRAGEKGQQNRTKAGKKIDPVGYLKPNKVTRNRADDDLDQRHRDSDTNRNERRQQRQSQPQCGLKPHARHDPLPLSRRDRSARVSHPPR